MVDRHGRKEEADLGQRKGHFDVQTKRERLKKETSRGIRRGGCMNEQRRELGERRSGREDECNNLEGFYSGLEQRGGGPLGERGGSFERFLPPSLAAGEERSVASGKSISIRIRP